MAALFQRGPRLRLLRPAGGAGARARPTLLRQGGGPGPAARCGTPLFVPARRGHRGTGLAGHSYRGAGSVAPSRPLGDTEATEQFALVYRFPGIKYCRMVSRMKLLQTGLTLVTLPPVCHLYLQEQVSQAVLGYVAGVAGFAAAMLYGMSYFLRRLIGLMYLNEAGTIVKVAHLTFWGRKKVIYCPVETVMNLSDTGDDMNELLLQFKQYNNTQVLYFTLKFGHIVDKQRFTQIFGEFY